MKFYKYAHFWSRNLCAESYIMLFYFRPAYWGTWRKKSKLVNGRKPFGLDGVHFDYEYDSDEDWEDEGEGESLSDAEDEKEITKK